MLDKSKYVAAEYRITVYGKDMMEWHKKGKKFSKFKVDGWSRINSRIHMWGG